MPRYFSGALKAAVVVLLVSCAPSIVQQPTQFVPGTGKTFKLARAADVKLSTGYSTTLRANTRWELVGTVPQGEVYRTKDQVVTLEGDHIHEGYVVVKQAALVGFYLPVERTFSPVTEVHPLSIQP